MVVQIFFDECDASERPSGYEVDEKNVENEDLRDDFSIECFSSARVIISKFLFLFFLNDSFKSKILTREKPFASYISCHWVF